MFDNYQNNILADNLINEIDILNAFVSKPIIKEDNNYNFINNENEIMILLKEKINEISILKKINFSFNLCSSFNQNIINFIENKYGNYFFKDASFRSLPIECFVFIYNIIKCKFITFLKNHYSSYFCQHLFFLLTIDIRKEIIIDICNNIDILYKNSNGQCSIIFLLENELTCEEKLLFLNLIRPNLMKLIWKPMFMRIIECILIRFPSKEVNFIIDYCIENMYEFLKLREGYFVVECAIKRSPLFEIIFMELLKSNINLLNRILQLSNCFKIFELMFLNFSKNNNKYLLKLLKQIGYKNTNLFLINFLDKIEKLLSSNEGNLIKN